MVLNTELSLNHSNVNRTFPSFHSNFPIYSTDVEATKDNRRLTTQLLVSIGYVVFMVAGV